MVKQDRLRRLRTSTRCLFAALVAACTPLTGVETSEQNQEPAVESDAGPRAPGQPESSATDAGAEDRSPPSNTAADGPAKPKDANTAGHAGDVNTDASAKTPMPGTAGTAAIDTNSAAGSGGTSASETIDVECVPVFVQEARGQFVQVRCQTAITLGGDRVEYVALPTKSPPATCTRFSELASAALLRAAPIGVRVSAAGRGNDSGCEVARCRTIRAFSQGM